MLAQLLSSTFTPLPPLPPLPDIFIYYSSCRCEPSQNLHLHIPDFSWSLSFPTILLTKKIGGAQKNEVEMYYGESIVYAKVMLLSTKSFESCLYQKSKQALMNVDFRYPCFLIFHRSFFCERGIGPHSRSPLPQGMFRTALRSEKCWTKGVDSKF